MDLNGALSIASSGLSALNYELALASQNVTNASTPGYVREIANVSSRDAGGKPGGVIIQLSSRAIDAALQNSLYSQNAVVAGLNVTVNALAAVGNVQGSTSADSGSANTLSDNLGNLANAFTTLDSDPSSTSQQSGVLESAATLAQSIQTLSSAYQAQRQSAEQAISSDVDSINSNLSMIGSLSQSILKLHGTGGDTTGLENQRSAAMLALSNALNVKFTETSAGDMLVSTASGLLLPTRDTSGGLSVQTVTTGVGEAYPGSIPGIELDGKDITSSLKGGSLGANIVLRDTTLPVMQAELDSFSATLAKRFSDQGLALFTDAMGSGPGTDPTSSPPAGQLGFSASIQVNPAVTANPSLVRDGNQAIQDPSPGAPVVAGAVTTGASAFVPNPVGGPVGFTTLIGRILNNTLGADIASGVSQPAPASTGMGVNGALSLGYSGGGDIGTLATVLTTSQANTIADATQNLSTQGDIQTTIQGLVATKTGVSVDDQMSNVVALQNAYEANAKVITAVQTMFAALIAAIS